MSPSRVKRGPPDPGAQWPGMTDAEPVTAPVSSGALAAGYAAFTKHAWQEAFDRFSEVDAAGDLSADDIEALATAAFFVARPDVQADAKERAFKRHEARRQHAPSGLPRRGHRPVLRLRGQARDRVRVGAPGRAADRPGRRHLRPRLPCDASAANGRPAWGISTRRSSSRSGPSRSGCRPATAT